MYKYFKWSRTSRFDTFISSCLYESIDNDQEYIHSRNAKYPNKEEHS